MTFNRTKLPVFIMLTLSLLAVGVGCKSVNSNQKSVSGVLTDESMMSPIGIQRRAIRLKGEVITEVAVDKDRKVFNLKVSEVGVMGPNFKGKEPAPGETISIIAPINTEVEKGDNLIVEVSTSRNQDSDYPMFNLLRKVAQ
ncbi:hypothetical protein [Roseivirga sp. E12]|uniref:hypothetical protein n=1 Tax=Roseivirga sp. E12 TaxID=2819237 RepID=UPI001ABCE861|nr:hypothetical protein [Roseivirga sp. E12]